MITTTSRNASLEVKELALSFSLDKKSKYLNRGKKTVEELVSIARKLGHSKIAIVKGKEKIDYIEIHHSGNWEWIY